MAIEAKPPVTKPLPAQIELIKTNNDSKGLALVAYSLENVGED
jgi:hypothetical protein